MIFCELCKGLVKDFSHTHTHTQSHTHTDTRTHRNPASIFLFKYNNERSRAICEIYPNLTIKTQNDVNDIVIVNLIVNLIVVLIVNSDQIPHIILRGAHRKVGEGGEGERPRLPIFEIREKCPDFGKEYFDCVHFWVECLI